MKFRQKLGMLEVSDCPAARTIANRYIATVYDFKTKAQKKIHFAVASSATRTAYIPLACYRGNAASWLPQPPLIAVRPDPIPLRAYQTAALTDWEAGHNGILRAPAGSGKTITAAELIRRKRQRACVIVPTVEIARQWERTLREYVSDSVGLCCAGRIEVARDIVVATYQGRNGAAADRGLVLVDECHRTPCRSIRDILAVCIARHRYGVTATPFRTDGLTAAMTWLLGGVMAVISRRHTVGHILPFAVRRLCWGHEFGQADYQDLQSAIAGNAGRNELIAAEAVSLASAGHKVLVLAHRLEQLQAIRREGFGYVDGRTSTVDRASAFARDIVLATYDLAGEGLDVPPLSALIMSAPTGNRKTIEQACGRIARPYQGKLAPVVIDIADAGALPARMAGERTKVYSLIGGVEHAR